MDILDLTHAHLVGEGRDRLCYEHPKNPDLCVKIPKKPEKQTRREKFYFNCLRFQKKDCRYLAQYQFSCQTQQGAGAVYTLVRDSDGNISKTLSQCISSNDINDDEIDSVCLELKSYLFDNAICVRDLSPNNVVLQKNKDHKRLIIIDGVSNSSAIVLVVFIPAWIRRHLKKSWNSFELKIKKLKHAKNT